MITDMTCRLVFQKKIGVNLPNKKLINNNWKKFSTFGSPTFKYIKKGKGHREAIEIFLIESKIIHIHQKKKLTRCVFQIHIN